MKNTDIDAKGFYIGTVVMSLNELGEKLSKRRESLQDVIASTDDISVRMKTALEADIIFQQLKTLTAIVDSLEKRNFNWLLKHQDSIEALYLQIKEAYPDYEQDLKDVKEHFIYTDVVEELMPKLSCVSFEDAENSFEMMQEACISAVKELIYNKRLMSEEGKTQELIKKEDELKQILTYFINQP